MYIFKINLNFFCIQVIWTISKINHMHWSKLSITTYSHVEAFHNLLNSFFFERFFLKSEIALIFSFGG